MFGRNVEREQMLSPVYIEHPVEGWSLKATASPVDGA